MLQCPNKVCVMSLGQSNNHEQSKLLKCVLRKQMFWVPTRSDTNQSIQLQRMVRGWKYRLQEVQILYYLKYRYCTI